MRTLAVLAILGALAICTTAQDAPSTVDMTQYGGSGQELLAVTAESLELKVTSPLISEDDLSGPCWIISRGTPRANVSELLSVALGCPVAIDEATNRLLVSLPQASAPTGTVKGYDVSVLAGRFVEYVNSYGQTRAKPGPGENAGREQTAAQHLADLLSDLLFESRGALFDPSVVGDRVLVTADVRSHARVREALDLLMSEAGGESAAMKDERAVADKLKQAKFSGELEGTPVASVIAAICDAAGVGMVLAPVFAESAGDSHIDFSVEEEITAWQAVELLFHRLEEEDWSFDFTSRCGAVVIENTAHDIHIGYRVYDVGGLLKKLNASYQRQKTAPGKADGFEGDLRDAGGVDVIVDALETQLEASDRAFGADVYAYAGRVVVRGGHRAVDAATSILEEMGWEPPKD
ncbi:MAG: hypothetical protein K8I27_05885 [Planctomycetes bacterium]|nr:hypothetical protein [Planctomycetota bacterium]